MMAVDCFEEAGTGGNQPPLPRGKGRGWSAVSVRLGGAEVEKKYAEMVETEGAMNSSRMGSGSMRMSSWAQQKRKQKYSTQQPTSMTHDNRFWGETLTRGGARARIQELDDE